MRLLLSAFVALCLPLTGCSEDSQAAGKEALERAGEDLERAGRDLADLMELGREAFTQTVERQLTNLDQKIEELKAKGGAEAEAALKRLQELRRDAAGRIEKLREAGGDAWRDLREGVARALQDLRRGVEEEQSGSEQKGDGR